jgi:carbonic anhydrase
VVVEGLATFLCVPNLSRMLAEIPVGASTRVELAAHYVDHAARDHLDNWVTRQRASGAAVVITQRGPGGRGDPPGKSGPAPRRHSIGVLDRRLQQAGGC